MEQLFDPTKNHHAAWTGIYDEDQMRRLYIGLTVPLLGTPLYHAAFFGLTGLARYLIVTHREDVNAKCGFHGSPLHAASAEGHIDVARVLLDHGADVNLANERGRVSLRSAYDGRHLRHDDRHIEVMRLLIERGTDVDMLEGSAFGTLLHDATWKGLTKVVSLLLQHKANVNARGDRNRTPLHFASQEGPPEVVRLLLEHGADVDAKDISSYTPLDYATHFQRHEVVHLLLEHCASCDVYSR
jgi:ankyrin repeat protein